MWHFVEPRDRIFDMHPAQYIPLIHGPMQEDSYYVESKYPDLYALNTEGDDDTHVNEGAYDEDHTMMDIVFTKDENQ